MILLHGWTSTYHLAVWALIPLLITGVSRFVVSTCRLGGSFIVDRYTALLVDTDRIRVQVSSDKGCDQGRDEEDRGSGTHLDVLKECECLRLETVYIQENECRGGVSGV